MSNIQSVNNQEYLRDPNTLVEKDRQKTQQTDRKQDRDRVNDVIDEKITSSIKQENLLAALQDIKDADEASVVLEDVLNKVEDLPSANKLHSLLDSNRVNALINQ